MKNVNDLVWEAIHTGEGALPWSVKGVETVAAGATATNPTPVSVELIGEIFYLPFIVPSGHVLVIRRLHLSTANDLNAITRLRLLVTGGGYTNIKIRDLIQIAGLAFEEHETGLWIPEGYSLRVDLANGSASPMEMIYMISGILVNISEAFKKERG